MTSSEHLKMKVKMRACENCGEVRPLNFFPFNIKEGTYTYICLACQKIEIIETLQVQQETGKKVLRITRAVRDKYFSLGCGICRNCGEAKPLDKNHTFFSISRTTRLGYNYECRLCTNKRLRAMIAKSDPERAKKLKKCNVK